MCLDGRTEAQADPDYFGTHLISDPLSLSMGSVLGGKTLGGETVVDYETDLGKNHVGDGMEETMDRGQEKESQVHNTFSQNGMSSWFSKWIQQSCISIRPDLDE